MTRAIPLMAAIILAAPLAFAQGVHPDCPQDPGDEQQAQAEASRWFGQGEQLVKQGKFNEGMGAFLCAYALAPHPAPIFNAGQAAASGGDDENAVKLLRQYVMIAPDGPMAPTARAQLAELEARGAGAPPPPMPVEPVEQPEPPPPPEEEEEEPWDVPEEQPEPEDDGGSGALTTAGVVLVVVGAAGVVVGAVLQGLAGKAVKDGEATDDYDVFKDQKDMVDGYQKGALAGFIAGGVLAVTGVILIAVDGGGEEPAAEVSLSPAPGGLVLGGTF